MCFYLHVCRSGNALAAFFRSNKGGVKIESANGSETVSCQLFVVMSDGSKRQGSFSASQLSGARLQWNVSIKIDSANFEFKHVERASTVHLCVASSCFGNLATRLEIMAPYDYEIYSVLV